MGVYKCENDGCTNPATMECPTCNKLSLPKSHYCAQKCFAAHWPQHKKLHKLVMSIGQGKVGQGQQRVNIGENMYAGNFKWFEFPGKLRYVVCIEQPLWDRERWLCRLKGAYE